MTVKNEEIRKRIQRASSNPKMAKLTTTVTWAPKKKRETKRLGGVQFSFVVSSVNGK